MRRNHSRSSPATMLTFVLVWSGQLVSLLGTSISSFALAIWVYQQTASVTQYTWVALCATAPGIGVAPLAGILIDRWSRRWIMVLSDICATCALLVLASLAFSGLLSIWPLCLGSAVFSLCGTFQRPAYLALVSELLPPELLGRGNGLIQCASAASQLLAPALAGILLTVLRLQGLFLLDAGSFLCSIATLLFALGGQQRRSPLPAAGRRHTLLRDLCMTWMYMRRQTGLLALLGLFGLVNFLVGMVSILVQPMVLAFTSTATLGTMFSICGSGMLIGAFTMSIWGGFRRHIHTILTFLGVCSFCLILAGARPSLVLITVAGFCFFFCLPLINSSVTAILQRQALPQLQGRLLACLDMLASVVIPVAYALAGPLADRVFEPAMRQENALTATIGRVIGTGQGRGIALLFILAGFLLLGTVLWGWSQHSLRHLEDQAPCPGADAQTLVKTDGA